MPNILHLAPGDSAAGCLRVACQSHGMPGTVLGIADDPSHGPLDDGKKRMDYMRDCFLTPQQCWIELTDAFDPWRSLLEKIDQDEIDTLIVWAGDNAAETIFLTMACWWLRHHWLNLMHVNVSELGSGHYVAIHKPSALAPLYDSARHLSGSGNDGSGGNDGSSSGGSELASAFEAIRAENGLLRRWSAGSITPVALNEYDPLLLGCCGGEWLNAARVVCAAMGQCDSHNQMSDLFFTSRLKHLIASGQIENSGEMTELRSFTIRLAR